MPNIRASAAYRRIVEAVPGVVVDAVDIPLTNLKARREYTRAVHIEAARDTKARDFEWRTARAWAPYLTGSLNSFR